MKKTIVYISFALCSFLGVNNAFAQSKPQFGIGYNAALPAGSFKDFMGQNSYRGFSAGIMVPLNNQLKLGAEVAHNDFYEKFGRQVIPGKEEDISAVVSNSIQITPFVFKAEYTLLPDAAIRPYLGAGAGFNIISFTQYLGEFTGNDKTAFKPALTADAGVQIPFNKITGASGIKIGANYNYLPFKYEGLKNLNNWGLHAGVFFPL